MIRKTATAAVVFISVALGSGSAWADQPLSEAEPASGNAALLLIPEEESPNESLSEADRLNHLADQINFSTFGEQTGRQTSLIEDLGLPSNAVIIESMGDYGIGLEF